MRIFVFSCRGLRSVVMMGLMMFCSVGWAAAAVVHLNDGRSVEGNITKKDAESLQISVDGVPLTYYADEIKDIDGKPFGAQQTQAASKAIAAAQPTTVTNPVPVPAAVAAQPASAVAGAQPVTVTTSPNASLADQDKKALILKFIDVFGTRQALTNNFELMLDQIAKDRPDEARKIRERVKVDEIIERLIPIYDRNFTTDDLKAFISFYQSPQGHKLIATIPELMKESVQESVKYMEEKFPEAKQQGT